MRGSYGPFLAVSTVVLAGAGGLALVSALSGHQVVYSTPQSTPAVASTSETTSPATPGDLSKPPVAATKDHVITTKFGAERHDPYYWLNEKTNPDVLAYLKAENDYAENAIAPLKPLKDELAKEIGDRANLEDAEVPYVKDGYYYQSRYAPGANYPVIVRHKGSPDAPEEVVLDVPSLAKGYAQYFLRSWSVSPDGSKVAFAVDFKGDRVHEIFVRDIATNTVTSTGVKDAAAGEDGGIVWTADGSAILYGHVDAAVRTDEIRRHTVGGDTATDEVLFKEPDTQYSLSVDEARSKKFAIITVGHLQRTELLAVSLTQPDATPVMLLPRTKNVRASADDLNGKFYLLTNDGAPDQKIIAIDDTNPQAPPTTVVPEVKGHFLDSFVLFNGKIAVQELHDAMQTVRVVDLGTGAASTIAMGDAAEVTFDRNEDPSLSMLRVTYQNPVTPAITYDVDLASGSPKEIKRDPMWTWFKSDQYDFKTIMAQARDGAQVPVTVIWRKDKKQPDGNPILVYGYGAYGIPSLPGINFYRSYVSLIDRGFVLAIAHVRGGREMGDAWYEAGRMQNKMNTFTDFLAATEAVKAQGYAKAGKVYAFGRSAGGLLMGAVNNLGGTTFDGIVAGVPFVDVLTTMLDDSIPLTTFEYEEWGNPNIPEQYDWMKAYSPYDNVEAKAYPALYVFTALNDSQVGYFEPAKWVAKLRATKTDSNPLLLFVNMAAGHSGNSGRGGRTEDYAKMYAWLLDRAGLGSTAPASTPTP